MASGAIVGECPVCDWWIYEDEFTFVGERMVHVGECRRKYTQQIVNAERVIVRLEDAGYTIIKPHETDLADLVQRIREEK